jgi:hypothetical protein
MTLILTIFLIIIFYLITPIFASRLKECSNCSYDMGCMSECILFVYPHPLFYLVISYIVSYFITIIYKKIKKK